MNTYLTHAKQLFLLSKKELNNAKQHNDDNLARDASGKAWIATTDALRGFLLLQGLQKNRLPKSERQRNDMLAEYCNEKMRSFYYEVRSQLHENAYYEGIINYLLLFEAMNKLSKFIHRCENGG